MKQFCSHPLIPQKSFLLRALSTCLISPAPSSLPFVSFHSLPLSLLPPFYPTCPSSLDSSFPSSSPLLPLILLPPCVPPTFPCSPPPSAFLQRAEITRSSGAISHTHHSRKGKRVHLSHTLWHPTPISAACTAQEGRIFYLRTDHEVTLLSGGYSGRVGQDGAGSREDDDVTDQYFESGERSLVTCR